MLQVSTYFDFGRLQEMIRGLNYVSSDSFLRSFGVKAESEKALRYLRTIFPQSDNRKNLERFGMHLVDGWKAIPFVGGGIGFSIQHTLEKNRAVAKLLNVIEFGHGPYQYQVKKTTRFFGKRYNTGGIAGSAGWVTLAKESLQNGIISPARTVYQSNREGVHYLENTREYIVGELLPKLREKIINKVKNRLERRGQQINN